MSLYISVVIPLYNKEQFIGNTLQSVLNQDYEYFEVIIVNDGSTDRSVEVVERFTDQRITIIHQENKGLSAARNAGIKASRHDYVAFLDADDQWCEDYLFTITNLINLKKDFYIFTTAIKLFRPKEKIDLASKHFVSEHIDIISEYFSLCQNIFGPSSMIIKKSLFSEIGYFNETITYGEGDDFFIRCFTKHDLVYYSEPKVYYLVGIDNQLTAPSKNSRRVIPDYEKYLVENTDKNLKKYIDFIHFKLVVLYKMEKNHKLVVFYKKKIDTANLSAIQKIKYHLPTALFYAVKSIYIWFSKRFIHS